MRLHIIQCAIAITAFLSPGLHAQTPAGQPAQSAPRTFRIVSIVGEYEDLKYDTSRRTAVPITISRNFSPDYLIPASPDLTIYKEVPPPAGSPDGTKPTKLSVITIKIPEACQRALILVVPLEKGLFAAKILDDDPLKHPAGTLRLINFSTMSAAAMIKESQHMLPPGDEKIVPFIKGPTVIDIRIQKNGKWGEGFRAERIARPALRAYGIITEFIREPNSDPTSLPQPMLFKLHTETVPALSSTP